MDLKDFLTPRQFQILSKSGIKNLYDLITYHPSGTEEIKTLPSLYGFFDENITYFTEGKLISKVKRKSKALFFQLQFQVESGILNCYFFSRAKFMDSMLQNGDEYQFMMQHKKGFWSIKKISRIKKNQNKLNYFSLGACHLGDYLLPVYPKNGQITNELLRAIHEKIPAGFYILNLEKLVPKSQNLISQKIDLSNIHHPKNQKSFQETKKKWVALKVFLKLSVMRKINSTNKDFIGKASILDTKFLKGLSETLPFELSQSQKKAIWDILNEVKKV